MNYGRARANIIRGLEDRAELLNSHQLDLIAQIEAHLRAVHHTMRRISSLRAARYRVGDDLSNGQRLDAIHDLASEITEIEAQLRIQQQTCQDMQALLKMMEEAAGQLRRAAGQLHEEANQPPTDAP